ncbi:hypothetical protein K449DRAFT_435976 [Hypoxylon sp. EC38]|nr:hypothetical protein K449DRAFT_435976 [Hypoxylon sp. EC38]
MPRGHLEINPDLAQSENMLASKYNQPSPLKFGNSTFFWISRAAGLHLDFSSYPHTRSQLTTHPALLSVQHMEALKHRQREHTSITLLISKSIYLVYFVIARSTYCLAILAQACLAAASGLLNIWIRLLAVIILIIILHLFQSIKRIIDPCLPRPRPRSPPPLAPPPPKDLPSYGQPDMVHRLSVAAR